MKILSRSVLSSLRRINKRIAIVSLVFLAVSAVPVYIFLIKPKLVRATWYNASWGYRKPITIVNNGGAQTDYTVEVTLDTQALQTANKLQTDCGDIRFTSDNGSTLQNFFTDYCSATSSVNSSFFVKLGSIAASGNTTIYVYYGNSGASDGQSAFSAVGYPSSVVLGTGKDGAATLSGSTNINTQNITIGTCADGGDGVIYTSTATTVNGTSNITLVQTPSSSCLDTGDEVLIFNAQGNNTGNGTGIYEFVRVSSQATNVITLNHPLTNTYNGTDMKVMVQRVPNYTNVTTGANALTPATWNGTSGGVVAFRGSGNVTVNATGSINANSVGYRGGVGPNFDNIGGPTGESYDGPSIGHGGDSCGSAGCADGATRGGGRTGDAGPTTNTTAGNVTGGGGGGGAAGSIDSTTGGGGGGGGGGYAGGGGGGGSNGDDNTAGATGGNGGTGGTAGTAAGGGAGACLDTGGAASNGNTGGNAGSSGGTGNCGNGNGSGGAVGSTTTQGGGGGGANNTTGGGAGGGGGGYYGAATLAALFFGSGGGAGGSGDSAAKGASGGAGGGLVYISSNNVTVSGNVSASGANGTVAPANAGNGGGGAGGSVYIKTVTDNLGSSLVTGLGGNGGGAGVNIADGGDGGNGRVHVDQTDTSNATTSPTANITRVPSIGSPGSEQLYADYAVVAEPSIYLGFNEGYGTTTYDTENTGSDNHNGTLAGGILPTWQTEDKCVSGSCLYFEKTSKVTLAGSTGVKTISLWIRPNIVANIAIFDFDGSTGLVTDGHGKVSASGFTAPIYYLNGHETPAPTLVAGQWQHLAVTTNTTIATEAMVVGTQNTTYYVGYIDELRMSSAQKTAADIGVLYNARGSYSGGKAVVGDAHKYSYLSDNLVGYWTMDTEGATSAAAIDYSGGQSGLKWASGSAYFAGKYGYGAEMREGKFSFLTDSSARLDNTQTIAFWVRPDAATNYFMSINEASIQSSAGFITTTGLSNPKVYVNGVESNAISTGAWQYVTVTTNSSLNSTSGDPTPDLLRYNNDSGYYSAISCVSDDDCKMVWMNYENNEDSMRFMDCDDATCSTGTVQILEASPGCVIHGGVGCDVSQNITTRYLAMHCPSSNDCKITYNGPSNTVRLIDCDDAECSSGTETVVDGAGCSLTSCNTTSGVNFYKSIYCPAGDDCKIAWYDNDGLRFADCDNATCTSGSVRMLDGAASGNALTNATTGSVGSYSDIYCPTADDCKLSYLGTGLLFADCSNAACSAGQVYTLDGAAGCTLSGGDGCSSGRTVNTDPTSIDCPTANDCKISYTSSSADVLMADCNTANCTSGSVEVVDGDVATCGLTNCGSNNSWIETSISCTATDNCKIGYIDATSSTNHKPMIAACSSSSCSSGVIYTLDGSSSCVLKGGDGCTNVTGNTTVTVDVTCPAGGNCKVAYNNGYNSALIMGSCADSTCSSGSAERIEGFKNTEGYFSSIDCPTAGDCKMAYLSSRASLMFMDCDDAGCTSGTTRVLDADSGCVLTGGDGCSTTRNLDGYLDLDCPTADDCKIIYYSSGETASLFADCDDATCSTGSVEILDGTANCSLTGGDVCDTSMDAGFYPTIDCPTAANCKVTYFDDTNNATYFGDCDDATCSTGSTESIDGAGCGLTSCNATADMRIASISCAASDDCKVSYHDYTNKDLRIADCDNETCSAGTVQTIDGGATSNFTGFAAGATLGDWNFISCPAADNCKVAYRSSTNTTLKFADCANTQCSSGTVKILDGDTGATLTGNDTGSAAGVYAVMQCPTSTNCKIIYQNGLNDTLHLADCDDETCSSGTTTLLDGDVGCTLSGGDGCNSITSTGEYAWLSCPSGDDCKIAYANNTYGTLEFGDCSGETCSSGTLYHADMGFDTTVTLGRVGSSNYMDGKIDEVRLYNRVLTQPEIQNLYQSAPGPVAWWKFDEGSGTNAYDSSGNGNTGTLGTGMKWGTGKYGSALLGNDEANQNVEVSNNSLFSFPDGADFTIEGWFKRDKYDTAENMFFTRDSSNTTCASDPGIALFLGSSTKDLTFRVCDTADNFYSIDTTVEYLSPVWHHFAAIWDDDSTTNTTLYVDAIEDKGSVNGTLSAIGSLATSGPLCFDQQVKSTYDGCGTSANGAFNGGLDDFKIYNYARTQKQIIEDMNAGHPAPGSPVGSYAGYWDFNEISGTTAHDQSINTKHLTVDASDWSTDGKYGGGFIAGRGARDASVTNATQSETYDFAATSDFTIDAWAKSTASGNPGSSEMIVGKGLSSSAGSNATGYGLYFDSSGHACLAIDDDTVWGPDISVCSQGDFYDATWHHILGVRDTASDKLHVYVDGIPRGSVTDPTTGTLDNDQSFRIGQKTSSDDGDEFQGLIDDVKVFRSALTADQVKLEYNRGSSTSVGSISSLSDGATATNSASAEFCIPGDTSTCRAPVGWWKMDDNTGSTTTVDSSGNGLNGTLMHMNASDWIVGKYGSGLNFDGVAKTVNITDSSLLTFPSAATWTGWIKLNASAGASSVDLRFLNHNGSSGHRGYYFQVGHSGGTLDKVTGYVYQNSDGCVNALALPTADSAMTVGQWYNWAYAWDGSTVSLYINGAKQTTNVSVSSVCDSDANLFIASDRDTGNYMNAKMDDMRIYNYARTPAQIAWDYNRGEPVGWWRFDEGSGDPGTIYDSSGNGRNGTAEASMDANDWVAGKFNTALDFDGTDDFITLSPITNINTFSASMWIYPASTSDNAIFLYDGNGNNGWAIGQDRNYGTCAADGELCVWIYGSATGGYVDFPYDLPANTWTHLVTTFDNTTGDVVVYINGVLRFRRTTAWRPDTSSAVAMSINRGDSGWSPADMFLNGRIDDVRVYNYVLTPPQVKLVMNENAAVRYSTSSGLPQ